MVQKGTTKGNVNFIVGGVTAILLGVVMMVLEFYLRDVAASWPRPVYTAIRAAGEGRAAPPSADALKLARLQAAINEGGSPSAAASPLVRHVDVRANVDKEPARPSVNWLTTTRTHL